MIENVWNENDIFDEHNIKGLISCLLTENNRDNAYPPVGVQIEFMERNGFDFGTNFNGVATDFISAVDDYYVPEARESWMGAPKDKRVPSDIVRRLGLIFKNHFRAKFGIPGMSQFEESNWKLNDQLESRPWLLEYEARVASTRTEGSLAPRINLNSTEIDLVLQCVKTRYPRIYEYQKVVNKLAVVQGYCTEDIWIDITAAWHCVDDCVEECVGHRLVSGEFLIGRPSNREIINLM